MGEQDYRGIFGCERYVFWDVYLIWYWCVVSGWRVRGLEIAVWGGGGVFPKSIRSNTTEVARSATCLSFTPYFSEQVHCTFTNQRLAAEYNRLTHSPCPLCHR